MNNYIAYLLVNDDVITVKSGMQDLYISKFHGNSDQDINYSHSTVAGGLDDIS